MSITKANFGTFDGKDVFSYTLDNGKGLCAEIITYGGIIKKLIYKGVDVVTGRDTMEEYSNNSGYFGAIVGRNSNRIENAEFELNGKVYKLAANDGKANLHGGVKCFSKRVWDSQAVDGDEPSLVLKLVSPDGEEGFPGEAHVKVTYTLTAENSVRIHYEGECDSDTVMNLTNHTYFNLNGHASGTVDNHKMWMNSSFYTPNTEECFPYGEVLSVKDTAFDFTTEKTLGEGFASKHPQVELFDGFDHNFALDGRGMRLGVKLTGDKTGIVMEMYTDQSAVQLYTGNKMGSDRVCKDGAVYENHGALCLETQAFPNSLKHSHFPGAVLLKGQKYDTTTEYKFI